MGRYTILVLVIFSLIIMAVLGYSLKEMRRTSIDTTTHYVQNLTNQLTKMIDLELNGGIRQLVSIGDSFEQVVVKKDDAAVEEFVSRKQALGIFDFIALEDTRNHRKAAAGKVYGNYAGDLKVLRSLEVSQLALKTKSCHASIVDENVIYAMPLYDEEEQIGFLWGGKTAESMKSVIRSRSFQEQSYSCIINKNGDVILSAENQKEFKNLESVFENGNDEKFQENMRMMKENIDKNESGIFRFLSEGGYSAYLAYTPMDIDDWVMLSMIPTDLLSTEYDQFVYLAVVAVMGTLLVFMVLVILLTRSYRINHKKLEQLAYTDEVTGGKNNQAFCAKYREMYHKTDIREYAIALVDVVNFKEVNKEFGMEKGDDILRYLYTMICSKLNQEQGEFAARSEMDRFFICLREKKPEDVQRRLNDIVNKINLFEETNLPHYNLLFRMAASFAEEQIFDPIILEDQVRSVLKLTDVIPGKCAFYSKDFEERVRREQELDSAFESALESEEFQVYFQPKASLEKGSVEGIEALVRWQHPERGLVPPNEFIPILEANGKILQLDKYVYEKVCIWLKKRKVNGETMIPVSVNLSRNYLSDNDFLNWFVETADKYEVQHHLIEFELTEYTFMVRGQIQQMKTYIKQMHELDFSLSIDDFGTGYSSISLLREFEVDVIKLDRSFFLALDDNKARDVISCLVDLAKKLNIRVVVEGIETKKQIEYLKKLNCDVVQGYFFSKPLPEEEFTEWYRNFDFNEYGA